MEAIMNGVDISNTQRQSEATDKKPHHKSDKIRRKRKKYADDERPFACPHCRRTYAFELSRDQHMRLKHVKYQPRMRAISESVLISGLKTVSRTEPAITRKSSSDAVLTGLSLANTLSPAYLESVQGHLPSKNKLSTPSTNCIERQLRINDQTIFHQLHAANGIANMPFHQQLTEKGSYTLGEQNTVTCSKRQRMNQQSDHWGLPQKQDTSHPRPTSSFNNETLFGTNMENLEIKNSGTSVFSNVSYSTQYANVSCAASTSKSGGDKRRASCPSIWGQSMNESEAKGREIPHSTINPLHQCSRANITNTQVLRQAIDYKRNKGVTYQKAESRHARLTMSSDEDSVTESTRTHLEDLLTAVGQPGLSYTPFNKGGTQKRTHDRAMKAPRRYKYSSWSHSTAPSANINNASMQIPLTRTDLFCTGDFRQNTNLSVNGGQSAFKNRVLFETLLRDLCAEPVLKPEQAQSRNNLNVMCGPDGNKHTNIYQNVAEANQNRRRLATSTSEDIDSSSGESVRSQASTHHSRSKAGSNHNEAKSGLIRDNAIPAHMMLLENVSTREANDMRNRNYMSADLTNLEFYDSLVEMYNTNQTTQGWQP